MERLFEIKYQLKDGASKHLNSAGRFIAIGISASSRSFSMHKSIALHDINLFELVKNSVSQSNIRVMMTKLDQSVAWTTATHHLQKA